MSQTGNTKKVAEPIYEEITVDKGIKEKIMRTSRSGLKGASNRLQTLIL
jgi:flavodoxin